MKRRRRLTLWLVRRAVHDIAHVDDLFRLIEEAHPTAISDHAAMRRRSAEERRALAERAQRGSSTPRGLP